MSPSLRNVMFFVANEGQLAEVRSSLAADQGFQLLDAQNTFEQLTQDVLDKRLKFVPPPIKPATTLEESQKNVKIYDSAMQDFERRMTRRQRVVARQEVRKKFPAHALDSEYVEPEPAAPTSQGGRRAGVVWKRVWKWHKPFVDWTRRDSTAEEDMDAAQGERWVCYWVNQTSGETRWDGTEFPQGVDEFIAESWEDWTATPKLGL